MIAEKSVRKLIDFLTKHAMWMSFLGLLTAGAGLYLTLRIPLETDLVKLLPDEIQSVKLLKKVKKLYGGIGNVVFVIESPDFSASLEFAETLREKLFEKGEVIYAAYGPEKDFFERYGLLLLEEEKLTKLKQDLEKAVKEIKLKASPFYFELDEEEEKKFDLDEYIKKYVPKSLWDSIGKEYFTNEDRSILLLFVQPAESLTDMKTVNAYLKKMRDIAESIGPERFHPDLQVSIGGTFRNRADEYNTILRDIKTSAGFTLGLIFIILSLFFNQITAVPVILLPLIESILVTSGLAYIFIGRLNFISAFLFAILLGLGVDFGIHIFSRYLEERRKGLQEALFEAIYTTMNSCIAAALTTSASLYVLVLFRFKGFSEFGLISGTGVILSYIWYVLFLPPLITLLEKVKLIKNKHFSTSQRLAEIAVKNSGKILTAGALILLAGAVGALKVEFETDFSSLRANLPSTTLVKKKIGSVFSLSASPAIAITDSLAETRELEEVIKEKIRSDPTPTIDAFFGLSTLLPENQERKLKIIEEMNKLFGEDVLEELEGKEKEDAIRLKKMLKVKKPLTLKDIPENLLVRFTDTKGRIGTVSYIYPSVGLVHYDKALQFKEDVLNIKTPAGKVFHAVNDNIVLADLYTLVIHEGKVTSAVVLVIIFVIILLTFRSFHTAVLVNSPLWVGLICALGFHALSGHKLNLFNLIVIPVLLGIGIDNAVHISRRILSTGDLKKTLSTTGAASFYTTVTTAIGFGSLITAYHEGLHSIGRFALLGLGTMLVFTVIIFPLFFTRVEPSLRKKKNAHRPS